MYDKAIKDNLELEGIKIKNQGTGFGVFGKVLEPNFDLTAYVPEGKELLLRHNLSILADELFHQKAVLTYKDVPYLQKFGWKKDANGKEIPGTSIEPRVRVQFDRPLSLDEIQELYKIMTDA
jgi:hypothetical protein